MPAPALTRSSWMREGRACMAARDWAGAIRAYGQGLMEQPLLGSHFPQWGRELWEPIRTAVQNAQLPLHTFVAEHEPRDVEQAFALVLQHPADLVHLSKPRLPAVLVDFGDEQLCNACEREPITLDGIKRRWIWPRGLTTGSRWPSGRSRRREQPGGRGDQW